jgi:hypothetical protein
VLVHLSGPEGRCGDGGCVGVRIGVDDGVFYGTVGEYALFLDGGKIP